MVGSIFNDEDSGRILALPLSINQTVDCEFWRPSPNGVYTMKSGYWLAKLGCNYMNSHAEQMDKTWGRIWNMDSPPKMKHFLWRACKGSLATNERLHYRHICDSPDCKLCGAGSETITHAIFECPNVRDIWDPFR
ncbi:hypothetical protein RDABS01_037975 [Bienertia sinuspersici]